jgi:hypothetical protein
MNSRQANNEGSNLAMTAKKVVGEERRKERERDMEIAPQELSEKSWGITVGLQHR